MVKNEMDLAVRAAVRETFTALGIDLENADEIRHFQANMAWVFRFRRLSERVGTAVLVTLVTILTGGLAKLIWDGFQIRRGG